MEIGPAFCMNLDSVPCVQCDQCAAICPVGAIYEKSHIEKVAVAHGLGNARRILEKIKAGENFHFIEVMACPGGCIGGGGQPRFTDNAVRKKRIEAIYQEDEGKKLRKSFENPAIKQIYAEFLGKPLSEKSHRLLHTKYTKRSKV